MHIHKDKTYDACFLPDSFMTSKGKRTCKEILQASQIELWVSSLSYQCSIINYTEVRPSGNHQPSQSSICTYCTAQIICFQCNRQPSQSSICTYCTTQIICFLSAWYVKGIELVKKFFKYVKLSSGLLSGLSCQCSTTVNWTTTSPHNLLHIARWY